MLSAFTKALGQFTDPATRGVVWMSVGLSALIFVLVWLGVGYLLTQTNFFDIGWLETAIDVLGGLATLVLSWLFFPAIVSAAIGLFLDRIADRVEARHYPDLPPARDAPMADVILTTVKFLLVMLGLNLVALVFLLFPPLFPFVFVAVNGYLLGREYFELVAMRRLDREKVAAFRGQKRVRIFVAGVIIALLLTVPIVNLLAPILGTAAMVHLFATWQRRT